VVFTGDLLDLMPSVALVDAYFRAHRHVSWDGDYRGDEEVDEQVMEEEGEERGEVVIDSSTTQLPRPPLPPLQSLLFPSATREAVASLPGPAWPAHHDHTLLHTRDTELEALHVPRTDYKVSQAK
jgi:hypothetical protein